MSSIWLASERCRLAVACRPQRQLDLTAQRRQRRAQLVCERRAELPHLADRVLESAERVVEGLRHFLELVADAARGQPTLERAPHRCRGRQLARRVSGASAKPDSHHAPAAGHQERERREQPAASRDSD